MQVGNGDVLDAADAQQLLRQTGCDGIMIGRGAVQDPFVFLRIKAAMSQVRAGAGSGSDGGNNSSSRECSSGRDGDMATSLSERSQSMRGAGPCGPASPSWDEAAAVEDFLRLYAGSGYGRDADGAHALVGGGRPAVRPKYRDGVAHDDGIHGI